MSPNPVQMLCDGEQLKGYLLWWDLLSFSLVGENKIYTPQGVLRSMCLIAFQQDLHSEAIMKPMTIQKQKEKILKNTVQLSVKTCLHYMVDLSECYFYIFVLLW